MSVPFACATYEYECVPYTICFFFKIALIEFARKILAKTKYTSASLWLMFITKLLGLARDRRHIHAPIY